jgi:hypothetical protein
MTQSVGGSDWQANSESGFSRSPYIKIHVTWGIPGATFARSGTRFPHVDEITAVSATTANKRVRMVSPPWSHESILA